MNKKSAALATSTGLAGLAAGGVLMGTFSANAAEDPGSGSSPGSSTSQGDRPKDGPGRGECGKEKELTGTVAEKVKAAVKKKYPDATIQRVESDADGVYEAHITVDGKRITVELDKSFAITGTETMPEGGRPGGPRPDGERPNGEKPAGEKSDGEDPAA